MPSFFQKITCPFCFSVFPPQDIRFRCMKANCLGRAPDVVYARETGYGTEIMGRVLVPKKHIFGSVPKEVLCDVCKTISMTHICPHCHFDLLHDAGLVDQRIIAIIGGRATGKTHYIASLVTRLQNEVGRNFSITVRMLGEHTQERWNRDFYTPLFINKRVLQANRPAAIDPQVKAPLVFRLSIDNGSSKRVLNLSFFDSAGEDMTTLSTISAQNRYIRYADGIIFLLDPLQIPNIRQQIAPANLPMLDTKASLERIVGNLRDLFEKQLIVRADEKVKIPIAFTLSKIDTLNLDSSSMLRKPSLYTGQLDLDEIQAVNTEVANYLSRWISPNFCDTIASDFARYSYFGVSSLGGQPDTNNSLSTISPLRVEDPFLWLLYQLGLIKGKKG